MKIIWTESQWLTPGLILLGLVALTLYFSYRQKHSMPMGLRWLAAALKLAGFALLLIFVLQPKIVKTFNRPGTNHWAILVDNSASMQLRDQEDGLARADRLREVLPAEPLAWHKQLSQDFVVESYSFDERLRPTQQDTVFSFDGSSSALGQALSLVKDRYQGRPLAGILVLTDGSPTDRVSQLGDLPPVFPLVFTPEKELLDLAIPKLTAQETLFEDAPLIVDVTVSATGMAGKVFVVSIYEEGGKKLAEKRQLVNDASETAQIRFQVRPEAAGTAFLSAEVYLDDSEGLIEATMENNRRLVAANRETGPYRVLYLGGRPNFEHKYLQRALEEDPSIRLTSLIRIARREPKFDYRSREGEKSNPLYRGFEEQEEAERYDEAVFLRLKTMYPGELAGGFPRTPEELFPFDTVILDDVEAAFFDREQMRLLQRYVSERGGSVIMLGGMESLDLGGYEGTAIGEMLPVYLEPGTPSGSPIAGRFALTREGRLEPWIRLRATEEEENQRIQQMPEFPNVHLLSGIRPGSMSIGKLDTEMGAGSALAVRRYGRGRTAVLAIGDLWRWGMKNPSNRSDMDKTWRQMTRWLLADVPSSLSVSVESNPESTKGANITIEQLGADFQPREAGGVKLRVLRPDGTWTQLSPTPHPSKTGILEATHRAAQPGSYLAEVSTRATEEEPSQTAQTGWVVNALQEEYLAIRPDMEAMQQLAEVTGGRVLKRNELDAFVAGLKDLPLPVEESRSEPLWNTPIWLLAALACFIGEWSLRRWKKLL